MVKTASFITGQTWVSFTFSFFRPRAPPVSGTQRLPARPLSRFTERAPRPVGPTRAHCRPSSPVSRVHAAGAACRRPDAGRLKPPARPAFLPWPSHSLPRPLQPSSAPPHHPLCPALLAPCAGPPPRPPWASGQASPHGRHCRARLEPARQQLPTTSTQSTTCMASASPPATPPARSRRSPPPLAPSPTEHRSLAPGTPWKTPSDTPHRAWNLTIELAVSWGTCSLRRSTSSPPGCALSTATSPPVHVLVVAVHRRSPPVSSSSCGKKQGDGESTIGRTLRTTPSTPSPPSSPARAGPPPAEHLLLPCHEEEEGGGGREGCFMINPLGSLCFPCYLLNTIH